MNTNMRLGMVFAILFVFIGAALACNISISSLEVGVKGENDNTFSENISAPKSTEISIKTQFTVDSFSGTDCPANISAKNIIYRYNTTTDEWEQFRTSATKSQTLSEGQVIFTWTEEFNTGTNDKYTQYKIEGTVLQNSTELDSQTAYVDVSDNSCSAIRIVANDISVNEGTTSTRTFRIENDSDYGFSISNLDFLVTSSLVTSGNLDYDNYLSPHSDRSVILTLTPGFVSNNQETTGQIELSGNLRGDFCSKSDVGVKTFQIEVIDTGATDNYYDGYYYGDNYYNDSYYNDYYSGGYYGTSSTCADITLYAQDYSIPQSTTQKQVFTLKNNSNFRFEITGVQVTSNGVTESLFDNDKYVFPGQTGSIIILADAPAVTQDKSYSNSVKVTGRFANGRACSYNDLNKQFTSTITSTTPLTSVNCSAFSINAPQNINTEKYGTVPFTISNMTNKPATIYIEGSVDATPTIITIPTGATISRSLNIIINQKTGYLNFRPVVEGCALLTKTTEISNTATATTVSQTGLGQTKHTGLFGLGNAEGTITAVILIIILALLIAAIVFGYGKDGDKINKQPWAKKPAPKTSTDGL